MKRLLTATLALALFAGTAAMAQPDNGDRHDHGGYNQDRGQGQGGYDQDRRHGDGQGGYNQDHGRGDGQNAYNQDRGDRDGPRNHRHDHGQRWARGQRLPREYYQDRSRYVDYRSRHLRRPPAGYRWVRTDDNNYAMVAITSGLIASIIAANR
jgi:Ni/Co efflux regulator RcnB